MWYGKCAGSHSRLASTLAAANGQFSSRLRSWTELLPGDFQRRHDSPATAIFATPDRHDPYRCFRLDPQVIAKCLRQLYRTPTVFSALVKGRSDD